MQTVKCPISEKQQEKDKIFVLDRQQQKSQYYLVVLVMPYIEMVLLQFPIQKVNTGLYSVPR